MFTVQVIGLDKTLANLNKYPSQSKTTRKSAHERIADQGVKIYSTKTHVITGKLRASIKEGKVDENTVEIISTVKYAFAENRRGSAHAFINDGTKELIPIAMKEELNAIKTAVAQGK